MDIASLSLSSRSDVQICNGAGSAPRRAMRAIKVGRRIEISPWQFIAALALITGALFFVTLRTGVDWFNESKAPDVVAALRNQTGAGLPVIWGWNHGQPIPAYYKMDERIVNSPTYA